jgi:hypothetical protein
MPNLAPLMLRILFCLVVGPASVLGLRTSEAQTIPPDLPKNSINLHLPPYEQAVADIEARGAARPKAVQPILPGANAGLSNPPSPTAKQPSPPNR